MKLDDVLVHYLGEFGKYQRRQYFLLCLPAILSALQVLVPVFTAAEPAFSLAFNHSDEEDGCFASFEDLYSSNTSTAPRQLCSSHVFDQSQLISTVVTEWDLVCNRKFLATVSSMVYMSGVLVGSLVAGTIADRIGRKKTLLMCLMMQGAFGVATSLAPEFYSYMAFRFVCGGASVGVYLICYVLGVELVGPSKRLFTAIVIMYFFSSGYIICSGIAYFIRTWRWIQMAISLPSFLFISYHWLISESPRWLLSSGRKDEAHKILLHAAKVNGVNLPADILEKVEIGSQTKTTARIMDVFKTRKLLLRTIVLVINWVSIAMCYYGLSYSTKNLSGSVYVNLILTGLVEFPAESAAFVCAKLGRKKPHVFGMLLGGVSCGCTIFLVYFLDDNTYTWAYIVLNMVGKFGVTMAFAIVYFWSAEVYPTVLRNSLIGISSAFARIGSILAPLIADAGIYVEGPMKQAVAPLIFSAATLIGGFLALSLPETGDNSLPDTMNDARQPLEETKLQDVKRSADIGHSQRSAEERGEDTTSRLLSQRKA